MTSTKQTIPNSCARSAREPIPTTNETSARAAAGRTGSQRRAVQKTIPTTNPISNARSSASPAQPPAE
jgi:hypothetical protein